MFVELHIYQSGPFGWPENFLPLQSGHNPLLGTPDPVCKTLTLTKNLVYTEIRSYGHLSYRYLGYGWPCQSFHTSTVCFWWWFVHPSVHSNVQTNLWNRFRGRTYLWALIYCVIVYLLYSVRKTLRTGTERQITLEMLFISTHSKPLWKLKHV